MRATPAAASSSSRASTAGLSTPTASSRLRAAVQAETRVAVMGALSADPSPHLSPLARGEGY